MAAVFECERTAAGANSTLVDLSLRGNKLDAESGARLAQSLLYNTSLLRLDLSNNVSTVFPSTLNPQPSTLNPQPSNLSYRTPDSTLNPQLRTLNPQS